MTLRHFADLILDLMGWIGGHLNAFHIKGHDYAPSYQREDEERNHNQEDFILSEVLSEKGKANVPVRPKTSEDQGDIRICWQ